MLDEDRVLVMVGARARDPGTRTDLGGRRGELPGTAGEEGLSAAERSLGFRLFPLHRRVLGEIADGGFGPGDGLVGLGGAGRDAHGRALIELREVLRLDEETPLPMGVAPLCDWGDGIWSCLDAATGHVLTLDEAGLTDTGVAFGDWLADWAAGESLFAGMFEQQERVITNPFTREPMVVTSPGQAIGTPYGGSK